MRLRNRVAKLEARASGGQAAPKVYTLSLNDRDSDPDIPNGYDVVIIIRYVEESGAQGAT